MPPHCWILRNDYAILGLCVTHYICAVVAEAMVPSKAAHRETSAPGESVRRGKEILTDSDKTEDVAVAAFGSDGEKKTLAWWVDTFSAFAKIESVRLGGKCLLCR